MSTPTLIVTISNLCCGTIYISIHYFINLHPTWTSWMVMRLSNWKSKVSANLARAVTNSSAFLRAQAFPETRRPSLTFVIKKNNKSEQKWFELKHQVCNLNFLSGILDGLSLPCLSLLLSQHQLLQFCLTGRMAQTYTQLTTVLPLWQQATK